MYDRCVTMRSKSTRSRPLALGYVRVSTAGQVTEGASLDAQRAALVAEADRRNWDVEIVADEGLSAKSIKNRAEKAVASRPGPCPGQRRVAQAQRFPERRKPCQNHLARGRRKVCQNRGSNGVPTPKFCGTGQRAHLTP